MVGVEFNPEVLGATFVLGLVAAGLYGMLGVSLVLTYRVSRTIGFVQGGIALFGMYLYWWLTTATEATLTPARMGRLPGLGIVTVAGALIGAVYGSTVTGRLANWPRVRVTTYSLAWLLALGTMIVWLFSGRFARVQGLPVRSIFGDSRYEILGGVVTIHQVVTLAILVLLVGVLSLALARTRVGIYVRAIADDPDAGRWVGIPLQRVGTGVFALSGAMAAFAGVLMCSTIGIDFFLGLVLFLRALTVSVLGGFNSLPLALAGCAVLGVGETTLSAGLFGTMSSGQREIVIMTFLFGLVFVINRVRPIRVIDPTS